MIVAAVPVKTLTDAKQRLVPVLAPPERRALAAAMLEDVLDALLGSALDAVWVVTGDEAVRAIARARGAACLTEPASRGHTEAVARAQAAAYAAGAERFLTVPGDVPAVTANEIRALCAAAPGAHGVALTPSVSGFGTNGALLAPPDAMPLKFGEPSFANHLEAARARDLGPVVVRLPGLALDIDAPEDLALLLRRRGGAPRTRALLQALEIPGRLARAG
jgi:2-phospho-L-lactate guanylyltransferase